MDISMDIHVTSVDMGMDMDVKFHIHGKSGYMILLVTQNTIIEPWFSGVVTFFFFNRKNRDKNDNRTMVVFQWYACHTR